MFNIFNVYDDDKAKEKIQKDYSKIKMPEVLKMQIREQMKEEQTVEVQYKPKLSAKRKFTVIIAAMLSVFLIIGGAAAIYGNFIFIPNRGFVDANGMEMYVLPEIQPIGDKTIETIMRIKENGENKLIIYISKEGPEGTLMEKNNEITISIKNSDNEEIVSEKINGGCFSSNGVNDLAYWDYELENAPELNEFILNVDGTEEKIKLSELNPEKIRTYTCEPQNGVELKLQFFTKRSVFFAVDYKNNDITELYSKINNLIETKDYSDKHYEFFERAKSILPESYEPGIMEMLHFDNLSFTDINGKIYENVQCTGSLVYHKNNSTINCFISNTRPESEVVSVTANKLEIYFEFDDFNYYAGLDNLPVLKEGESYKLETPISLFGMDGFDYKIDEVNCVKDGNKLLYNMNIHTNYFPNEENPKITFRLLPSLVIYDKESNKYTASTSFTASVSNPPTDPDTNQPIYDEQYYTADTKLDVTYTLSPYNSEIDFSKLRIQNFSYLINDTWILK